MDDNCLASYIPLYGDRIATRRFCSEHQRKGERAAQRQTLLQKLRSKMSIGNDLENSGHTESDAAQTPKAYLRNNKMATRKTRKVELGWIHEGKQQRKKSGGGTRKIDLPKESKKADIMCIAKELFFPNGKSKQGKIEDFTFDILDYQEDAVLDEDVTIGELYSLLKMGILRFYLCTRKMSKPSMPKDIGIANRDIELDEADEEDELNLSKSSKTSEVFIGPQTGEPLAWQLDDTVAILSSGEENSVILNVESTDVNLVSSLDHCLSDNSVLLSTPVEHIDCALVLTDSQVPLFSTIEEETVPSVTCASTLLSPTNQAVSNSSFHSASCDAEQPASTFVLPTLSASSWHNESYSNSEVAEHDAAAIVNIKVHRTNIMDDMITYFKDPTLLSCPLKFSFIDEIGADADGVSRDVYSAFWTEFLDRAAEGQEMRVPLLSPKWQEEEWRSIGRILVKGFQDHHYFPSRLALAFTMALVFGEHSVSPDILFESMLLYISPEERDLVNKALLEDLLAEEQEELLDLFDRLGAKSIPTKENLKPMLLSIAHKLIIQHPKYALDKMSEVARKAFRHAFPNQTNIQKMYENGKPTTRKVVKLLDASPATQAESQSLRYLQQYIRGLDQTGLRKFLRFTTGSDVLCVDKLEIVFTSLDGVARRPVAHTCGPVLELPWTYLSFPELRVELDSILSNNSCLVMNIA